VKSPFECSTFDCGTHASCSLTTNALVPPPKGDPRKEESLHHFKKNGMNMYQTAISKICTILAEYDSDQKYPVWGFGAKRDGKLSQCFRVGEQEEVDGVDGILAAYKHAFKSGIAMSSPTNVTEVIKAAGKDARKCLVRNSFSV
jgi:hypothetical protein